MGDAYEERKHQLQQCILALHNRAPDGEGENEESLLWKSMPMERKSNDEAEVGPVQEGEANDEWDEWRKKMEKIGNATDQLQERIHK